MKGRQSVFTLNVINALLMKLTPSRIDDEPGDLNPMIRPLVSKNVLIIHEREGCLLDHPGFW